MTRLTDVPLTHLHAGSLSPASLPRPPHPAQASIETVSTIIEEVRLRGDDAVLEYGRTFDGVTPSPYIYEPKDLRHALDEIDTELASALARARDRVADLARDELPLPTHRISDGIAVSSKWVPVDRAGCYVPGGKARYPSSVIHTAMFAKVAGVPFVVVATPPQADGTVDSATLAAASLVGVDLVLAAGGAQAVGALAYGTQSFPPVDVIAGPGNLYVSLAQRLVANRVGVPSAFAGPSEVAVVSGPPTPPEFAAIDIAVQAEHGPDGLAWLITWDDDYGDRVTKALENIVLSTPRHAQIAQTLSTGGFHAHVRDRTQALEVIEIIAPEHLELLYPEGRQDAEKVSCAGAIFVGENGTAAWGDYVAGPSHVLPTHQSARFGSVLGAKDFLRHIHTVEVMDDYDRSLAKAAITLAESEGLAAHGESIRLRDNR